MKAIRIMAHGGAEALAYQDVPDPQPAAGQALVRVEAVGVNYIDIYQRTGLYKVPLPFTPGQEAAGTVLAIGDGVTTVAAGDRVAWAGVMGSYAGQAVVAADRLVRLPAGVTARQGAAIMLQGMTAHYLAIDTYPLKAGDTCLVLAGAGGVGLLLTQIAKFRGARVISAVSTDEKAALSRQAGADHVVLYTKETLDVAVREATGGQGVQVVYDSVGQATFEQGLKALAPRGMMALFGASSGPVAPLDPQRLAAGGSLFLTRPTLTHYIISREELQRRAADLFGWIAEGRLQVRIGHEYPLDAAAEAHRALEGRQTTGKVLLIPG